MPDKPSITKGLPTVEDIKTIKTTKKWMLSFAQSTDDALDKQRQLVDVLEQLREMTEEAEEATKNLTETQNEAAGIADKESKAYKDNLAMQKMYVAQQDKLKKAMEKTSVKAKGLNAEYTKSTSTLNNLGKGIGKVALRYVGWGAILAGVLKGLREVDDQSQQIAKHSLDFADIQGSVTKQVANQANKLIAYSQTLTTARMDMLKYGYSVKESTELVNAVMDKMRDHTLNSIDTQAQFATNLGFLSKALRIDTSEALDYAKLRVEKFGGSSKIATDDMADLYTTITKSTKNMKNYKFQVSDLTKMVFEQAAGLDTYEIDLRALSTIMTTSVDLMDKMGASQALAIKATKDLADLMTNKAPPWLVFTAGGKLASQLNTAMRGFKTVWDDKKGVPANIRKSIITKFMGYTEAAYKGVQERGGEELEDINKRADQLANTYKTLQGQGDFALRKVLFSMNEGTEEGLESTFQTLSDGAKKWGYYFVNNMIEDTQEALQIYALLSQKGKEAEIKTRLKKAMELKKTRGPVTADDLKNEVGERLQKLYQLNQGIAPRFKEFLNLGMSSLGPAIIAIAKKVAFWEEPEEAKQRKQGERVLKAEAETGLASTKLDLLTGKRNLLQENPYAKRMKEAVGSATGVAASQRAEKEYWKIKTELEKSTDTTGLKLSADQQQFMEKQKKANKDLLETLRIFKTKGFGTDEELKNLIGVADKKRIEEFDAVKKQTTQIYAENGPLEKRMRAATMDGQIAAWLAQDEADKLMGERAGTKDAITREEAFRLVQQGVRAKGAGSKQATPPPTPDNTPKPAETPSPTGPVAWLKYDTGSTFGSSREDIPIVLRGVVPAKDLARQKRNTDKILDSDIA